jgi:hypothetical protein
VDGPQARFPGYAVEFLQSEFGAPDGEFDAGHETIGECRMGFDGRVVDNLRDVCTHLWRHPLPRHPAVQGQDGHLNSVRVHPLEPLGQVEV